MLPDSEEHYHWSHICVQLSYTAPVLFRLHQLRMSFFLILFPKQYKIYFIVTRLNTSKSGIIELGHVTQCVLYQFLTTLLSNLVPFFFIKCL